MTHYTYNHKVSFEETNLVGNVYFVHYLRWQGKCREMFLRDHTPSILEALREGFALATVRCSCDYFLELHAFEEVEIRMHLKEASQNQIAMNFEYWRIEEGREEQVAKGFQQVACMRRQGKQMVPVPIPQELQAALRPYR